MTRIRFAQHTFTEYEIDIDLPESVQAHLDRGSTLDTLDDEATIDLYEVLTTNTNGNDIDFRVDDTVITDTDLPGHTPILPITI